MVSAAWNNKEVREMMNPTYKRVITQDDIVEMIEADLETNIRIELTKPFPTIEVEFEMVR